MAYVQFAAYHVPVLFILPYLQITLCTHAVLLKAARMHTHKTACVYTENPQKMRMHAHNSVHTYKITS